MILPQAILLFGAALLAGALNSVAGGGSFISFPALVLSGIPPIPANATNAAALLPGGIASTIAYRRELQRSERHITLVLSIASIIGGVIGALVLLRTPPDLFQHILPYLLLIATLLFAFGENITAWLQKHVNLSPSSRFTLPGVALLQLIIAIYGGFFGGGMSILMLATLSLLGMENIHHMNALKTLLNSFINGIAVATFLFAGVIVWPAALVMIAGAILGGYAGAAYARQIKPILVRRFAIITGLVMSLIFSFADNKEVLNEHH